MSARPVDDLDRLFELEPAEFVAARDALAQQLRVGGERDRAAEVKALRRPTVAAWALNQVARQRADDVAALAEAGHAVQEAQARAVGSGDRSTFREATDRRRRLIAELTRAAVALAGDAHRDAIAATLETASLDDEAAAALRGGRLTKELEAPASFGFDGLSNPGPEAAPRRRKAPAPRPDRRQAAAEKERAEKKRAEQQERARAAVAEAEAELAAATARLEAARAALEEAER